MLTMKGFSGIKIILDEVLVKGIHELLPLRKGFLMERGRGEVTL